MYDAARGPPPTWLLKSRKNKKQEDVEGVRGAEEDESQMTDEESKQRKPLTIRRGGVSIPVDGNFSFSCPDSRQATSSPCYRPFVTAATNTSTITHGQNLNNTTKREHKEPSPLKHRANPARPVDCSASALPCHANCRARDRPGG